MGRSITGGARITDRGDEGQQENYGERIAPSRRERVQVDCG